MSKHEIIIEGRKYLADTVKGTLKPSTIEPAVGQVWQHKTDKCYYLTVRFNNTIVLVDISDLRGAIWSSDSTFGLEDNKFKYIGAAKDVMGEIREQG